MELKCEFSLIRIPSSQNYAPVAAGFVAEIAKMTGFGPPDVQQIEKGIHLAFTAIVEYSFEPSENELVELSCERIPEGLKIVIHDWGLPFDGDLSALSGSNIVPEDTSSLGYQIFQLQDYLDELQFHNLGRDGKEIVLIKHISGKNVTEYFEACVLEPYATPLYSDILPAAGGRCTVRPMQPSEAAEISKSVYKTYGYSYVYDIAYFPEKIVALNQSGKLYSAVAVAGDKIAGHCALKLWDHNPDLAEMVMGVVKPEYRSIGCFAQLTEYLIEYAGSKKIKGIFTQAVTSHPYSQKTARQFDLKDSAVMLAYVPDYTIFKEISEKLPQRESMVLQFKYLNKPDTAEIHPPPRHRQIIEKIYHQSEVFPIISESTARIAGNQRQTSVFKIDLIGPMNFARISIQHYGQTIIPEIKRKLKELCRKKIEVIHLLMDLSDPMTAQYSADFETLGFFFCGVLPTGLPTGDAVICQYLNNVTLDYGKIKLASEMGKQLLDYIKKEDPNRI